MAAVRCGGGRRPGERAVLVWAEPPARCLSCLLPGQPVPLLRVLGVPPSDLDKHLFVPVPWLFLGFNCRQSSQIRRAIAMQSHARLGRHAVQLELASTVSAVPRRPAATRRRAPLSATAASRAVSEAAGHHSVAPAAAPAPPVPLPSMPWILVSMQVSEPFLCFQPRGRPLEASDPRTESNKKRPLIPCRPWRWSERRSPARSPGGAASRWRG